MELNEMLDELFRDRRDEKPRPEPSCRYCRYFTTVDLLDGSEVGLCLEAAMDGTTAIAELADEENKACSAFEVWQ